MITKKDLETLSINTPQLNTKTRMVITPPNDTTVFMTKIKFNVNYHTNEFQIQHRLSDDESQNTTRALEILRDKIHTDIIIKLQDYTTNVLNSYETVIKTLTPKKQKAPASNLLWSSTTTPKSHEIWNRFIDIMNNIQLSNISIVGVDIITKDIIIGKPDISQPTYLGSAIENMHWLPTRCLFKRNTYMYLAYDPATYELHQIPTKNANEFENNYKNARTKDEAEKILHQYTLPIVSLINDAMDLASKQV